MNEPESIFSGLFCNISSFGKTDAWIGDVFKLSIVFISWKILQKNLFPLLSVFALTACLCVRIKQPIEGLQRSRETMFTMNKLFVRLWNRLICSYTTLACSYSRHFTAITRVYNFITRVLNRAYKCHMRRRLFLLRFHLLSHLFLSILQRISLICLQVTQLYPAVFAYGFCRNWGSAFFLELAQRWMPSPQLVNHAANRCGLPLRAISSPFFSAT